MLAENTTAPAMCAKLGFHIASHPTQRGIVLATLDVPTEAPDGNRPQGPNV